jgi:hypothetical protein
LQLEAHGRIETERLVAGLERLPYLDVCCRRIIRHEFDLDAAAGREQAARIGRNRPKNGLLMTEMNFPKPLIRSTSDGQRPG